ncbi:conserved hypothetical protein [Trichinella spiralis]|uniref:hypothetical protein n=1 Tax=Trichinella spiralis TaxID=6334 RepID=UPI0001EFC60B|nr:conserved hypothetical protein [Trichinella spiralis]
MLFRILLTAGGRPASSAAHLQLSFFLTNTILTIFERSDVSTDHILILEGMGKKTDAEIIVVVVIVIAAAAAAAGVVVVVVVVLAAAGNCSSSCIRPVVLSACWHLEPTLRNGSKPEAVFLQPAFPWYYSTTVVGRRTCQRRKIDNPSTRERP